MSSKPSHTSDAEWIDILRQTQAHLSLLTDSGVQEIPMPKIAMTPPADRHQRLQSLQQEIGDCRRCKLAAGRTHIVFGTGNPDASLMFVGEAPGADEDLQGKPFVGKAGQLLTRMIEAMGLTREDVYIANIIKCRPPGNRNPEEEEVQTCEPFLWKQIEIIQPRMICALGKFAAQTLLRSQVSITQLRGKICDLPSSPSPTIPVIPTFHPAYLLRNPSAKKLVWEDLQVIMKALDLPLPVSSGPAANVSPPFQKVPRDPSPHPYPEDLS